jgi:hypothetical protein
MLILNGQASLHTHTHTQPHTQCTHAHTHMHKNTYINIQIKYSHACIHSHLQVHLPTQPPNHPPTHTHPPKLLTLCMSVLLHFLNLSNVSCVVPKLCFNVKFTKCDNKEFCIDKCLLSCPHS